MVGGGRARSGEWWEKGVVNGGSKEWWVVGGGRGGEWWEQGVVNGGSKECWVMGEQGVVGASSAA